MENTRAKGLKSAGILYAPGSTDLTGSIIADKANWTPEEIIAWLDNQEKRAEQEYSSLQVEFDANGQRSKENGFNAIWARAKEELRRESEQYIL
jgi:hypothetical protein